MHGASKEIWERGGPLLDNNGTFCNDNNPLWNFMYTIQHTNPIPPRLRPLQVRAKVAYLLRDIVLFRYSSSGTDVFRTWAKLKVQSVQQLKLLQNDLKIMGVLQDTEWLIHIYNSNGLWEETVAHSGSFYFNGAMSLARRQKVKQSMSWMVTVLHNAEGCLPASVLVDVTKGRGGKGETQMIFSVVLTHAPEVFYQWPGSCHIMR